MNSILCINGNFRYLGSVYIAEQGISIILTRNYYFNFGCNSSIVHKQTKCGLLLKMTAMTSGADSLPVDFCHREKTPSVVKGDNKRLQQNYNEKTRKVEISKPKIK